jgi:hypothetical protein
MSEESTEILHLKADQIRIMLRQQERQVMALHTRARSEEQRYVVAQQSFERTKQELLLKNSVNAQPNNLVRAELQFLTNQLKSRYSAVSEQKNCVATASAAHANEIVAFKRQETRLENVEALVTARTTKRKIVSENLASEEIANFGIVARHVATRIKNAQPKIVPLQALVPFQSAVPLNATPDAKKTRAENPMQKTLENVVKESLAVLPENAVKIAAVQNESGQGSCNTKEEAEGEYLIYADAESNVPTVNPEFMLTTSASISQGCFQSLLQNHQNGQSSPQYTTTPPLPPSEVKQMQTQGFIETLKTDLNLANGEGVQLTLRSEHGDALALDVRTVGEQRVALELKSEGALQHRILWREKSAIEQQLNAAGIQVERFSLNRRKSIRKEREVVC